MRKNNLLVGCDIVSYSNVYLLNRFEDLRWMNKVFNQDEIKNIIQSDNPQLYLFKAWALKESCYKILTKLGVHRFMNFKRMVCNETFKTVSYQNKTWFGEYFNSENHLCCHIVNANDKVNTKKFLFPAKDFNIDLVNRKLNEIEIYKNRVVMYKELYPITIAANTDISWSHSDDITLVYYAYKKV